MRQHACNHGADEKNDRQKPKSKSRQCRAGAKTGNPLTDAENGRTKDKGPVDAGFCRKAEVVGKNRSANKTAEQDTRHGDRDCTAKNKH